MGECSFGKGFGQTNPDSLIEDGVDEKIWKSIPRSIFDGLSKRYQASSSSIADGMSCCPRY